MLGPKFVDRSRVPCREWNLYPHPLSSGQVSRELPERYRIREAAGKLGHLQAFACIRQDYQRQLGSRNRLRRVYPKRDCIPAQPGKTIAEIEQLYFRFPGATLTRLPREPQGIRRRDIQLAFDRKFAVLFLQSARGRGTRRTVEIRSE